MNQAQRSLFDFAADSDNWPEIKKPKYRKGADTLEKFKAFHAANPHIYEMLRDMALDLYRSGHQRWGMKALYEVLRYQYAIRTSVEDGEFALNNNYTSLYARMLMANEPLPPGFFETRELRQK